MANWKFFLKSQVSNTGFLKIHISMTQSWSWLTYKKDWDKISNVKTPLFHLHRFSCPSSGCIRQGRSSCSQPSDRCRNGSSCHFWSNTRWCLWRRRYTELSNSIHGNHFPNGSSNRQWTQATNYLGQSGQSYFPGCDVVLLFLHTQTLSWSDDF